MKKIVVVGSSNVDTTLHVKEFPQPGETINATEVSRSGGGKGANQAIAAAKSGADTLFISRVGEDSDGEFMMKQLKSYGVSLDYVENTQDQDTGHAFIILNEAGQDDIIIDHGANYSLSVEDVDAASDMIADMDCMIAQFETPLDVTIKAFKLAKERGAITILNPAPSIPSIPEKLLTYTDMITPNETECERLTDITIKNQQDLQQSAQELHRLGVKNVVITYGKNGSYISTPNCEKLIPAFDVDVVDTTAAGDTFIGFLAANLNKDLSNIEEAATIASRAASIAVQRLGAQPSIPTAKEVRDLMER